MLKALDPTTTYQVRLLALYATCLAKAASFGDENSETEAAKDGVSILANAIGMDYSINDILGPGLQSAIRQAGLGDQLRAHDVDLDRTHPVSSLRQRFLDNPLAPSIGTRFGQWGRFQYEIVAWAMTAATLANFSFCTLPIKRRCSTNTKLILSHEHKAVDEFLQEFVALARDNEMAAARLDPRFPRLDTTLLDKMGSRKAKTEYAAISSYCINFVNQLLPGFDEHISDCRKAYDLIGRMRGCLSGASAWRDYEELCLDALTYLLRRSVRAQAVGGGGSVRRDAIFENDAEYGFWRQIREDFQARNVVCEFKNVRAPIRGAELGGLRLYLSNPAMGRFGLLFTRRPPSRAAITAQQAAYQQTGTLILIIDDACMSRLLKARAFLGTGDGVLSNMRHDFEMRL